MNGGKSVISFLLLAMMAATPAWADRGHGHLRFGVVIGPGWGPWYYPPPYYYPPYYPPVVVERPAPPAVYIERPAASASVPNAPPYYWYFCSASNAYYPYVKECPGGWQKVQAQPPSVP